MSDPEIVCRVNGPFSDPDPIPIELIAGPGGRIAFDRDPGSSPPVKENQDSVTIDGIPAPIDPDRSGRDHELAPHHFFCIDALIGDKICTERCPHGRGDCTGRRQTITDERSAIWITLWKSYRGQELPDLRPVIIASLKILKAKIADGRIHMCRKW